MLDWLLKFNRVNFAEGAVGFQTGAGWAWLLLLVVLLATFGAVYWWTDRYAQQHVKAVSWGLRAAALCVLFIPLFQPVLITPDVVPDENFVAVLVDASTSMNVADGPLGGTRYDDARQLLFGESGVAGDLEEIFKLRTYTFAGDAVRVDSLAAHPAGDRTDLSAALRRVLADFQGVPLAGVVLFSDGGDNTTDVPLNLAEALRARDVPLHIVGLGREGFAVERELLAAEAAKSVEATTGAEIDVRVRSWGAEDAPVAFTLFRGETRVFTEARQLKGEGKIDQFTFFYEPEAAGAAEYILQVEPAEAEQNIENNTLDLLIDTRRDTLRVLYFEGHLRRDFKFIKRALEDDQVIEFASVSRTGTGKFYRQGIHSADEMAGGFPNTPAALNRFHAVIFGDVEASFFTLEQLQMVERFVRNRGGGFLMLGGRQAFAEGDYWNTPIADLLPTELDLNRRTVLPIPYFDPDLPVEDQGFRLEPTAEGFESPILKLSPDPATNRTRWTTMPPLTSLNLLGPVKPGATVLAVKPADQYGEREPLLVTQRYGKGRTLALPTASTWRWQMYLDAADARHERFWRQLARWLVAEAPDRVDLDLARRFDADAEIPLTVHVYDPVFAPLDDASVGGRLLDPHGVVQPITFVPALAEPGVYTATFVPEAEGVYEVVIAAEAGGALVGTQTQSFLVRPSKREFHDATLKRPFLEHLAETAGGMYYAASEIGTLPENLRSRRTSTSVFHAKPLWDMPLLLLLALTLLSAEWLYRRRKGLP